jgi:hypothetical protein
LLSLCQIIPFLGIILILGYRAELADEWDDQPDDRPVHEFRFDRFSELVSRGIWPFLYFLIQASIWFVGYMVTYLGMVIIMISQGGNPDKPLLLATLFGWMISISFLWYATTMISWPFVLYASRNRQFAFGAACRFARGFYARVGWSMVGLLLPKILLDSFLYLCGFICCYIGLFPASVVIMLAEQHFLSQLYRKYLERGGMPVPVYQPPEQDDEDQRDVIVDSPSDRPISDEK